MEGVCYEKSQSKTNGLPFVTVPEAMHHELSQTKEELVLNAACGSMTHLRGIVPGTSLLQPHWCLMAFAKTFVGACFKITKDSSVWGK